MPYPMDESSAPILDADPTLTTLDLGLTFLRRTYVCLLPSRKLKSIPYAVMLTSQAHIDNEFIAMIGRDQLLDALGKETEGLLTASE